MLNELKKALREHFDDLIRKYPSQAQNEKHFQHKLDTARLGRMKKRAVSKLARFTFDRGDIVLQWNEKDALDSEYGSTVSVWKKGAPAYMSVRPDFVTEVQ